MPLRRRLPHALNLGVNVEKLDSLSPAQMEDELEEEVVFWYERYRADGAKEGRIQGIKHILHRLTVRKFGSGTAARLDALLVDAAEDRLASALDLVFDCETGDDLLAQIVAGGNDR